MKNTLKNGFTLIELLAVIVILAVLMLVAGTNVFGIIEEAQRGTFQGEFLTLLQSTNSQAQLDILNGELKKKGDSKCYNITELETVFDNKNNYVGSVLVTKEDNGKLTFKGWMSGNQFIVEGGTDTLKKNDVQNYNGTPASTKCGK